MRARLAVLGAGMLAALGGCVSGLHSSLPEERTYLLLAGAPAAARPAAPDRAAAADAPVLRVLTVEAAPGRDTDRILLLQPERRLTAYQASRWAAPLPALLQAAAVETLRGQGSWRTVEDARGSAVADYTLQLTIRRFEAEDSGAQPPLVQIGIDAILQRRGESLAASFAVDRSARAAENRLGAIVEAFAAATDEALEEVGRRCAQELRTSTARSPP